MSANRFLFRQSGNASPQVLTADIALLNSIVEAGPAGGLNNVVEDLTPQLGGDLDLNTHVITGLVPGVNIQAYSANLDAVAAVTVTAAGTALLDDANAAAQRTTLGLGNIATQNTSTVSITGGSITGITDLAIADGGTGSSTAPAARAALGLEIGVDVQAYNANLTTLAGTTVTSAGTALLDDADASAQRTTLGLGTIATQNANNVTISGGSISGIVDITVADGGTGASTASGARTNLGLVIGTDVQAYDADLVSIAGLPDPNVDKLLFWDDSAGAYAYLGLGTNLSITGTTIDATGSGGLSNVVEDLTPQLGGDLDLNGHVITGMVIGTNIQAYDAELAALAGLTSAADKGIQFTGSGTAGTYDLTAAAKTVLDDTTVAAMVDTLGGASSTGTGGLVRATSPTLVTPTLGAATATSVSAGTLTSTTSTTVGGNSTASGVINILEDSDNGSHKAVLTVPASLAADTRFQLPGDNGTNLYVLQTDGSGNTSWVAQSGGGGTAATQSDQETATSTTTFVSPGRQQYHPSAAKAWVNFNGQGTVAIRVSYNVTSITDGGTGGYTVNFTTNMSTANYAVAVGASMNYNAANIASPSLFTTQGGASETAPTTSAFTLYIATVANAAFDSKYICATVFGDE